MGFRLVRVRLSGQNRLTLQIMAERLDGTMSVEDCEEVSRAVSPALDVDDPVDRAYHLAVSSPGLDGALVRRSDFESRLGHLVRIETAVVVDGRKRFRGKIAAAGPRSVTVQVEADESAAAAEFEIPFDALTSARLVLTDDLIRDALKEDRRLRRQARKSRG